jgi:hypothetical protein
MSGCFQCGDTDGSELQLCRTCQERNNQRRDKLRAVLHVNTDPTKEGASVKLLTNARTQSIFAFFLWYLITGLLILLGVDYGVAIEACVALSAFTASLTLFIATYLLLCMSVMTYDTIHGVVALLIPGSVYRLIFMTGRTSKLSVSWEQHRGILLANLTALLLVFVSVWGLRAIGVTRVTKADRIFVREYGVSLAEIPRTLGLLPST